MKNTKADGSAMHQRFREVTGSTAVVPARSATTAIEPMLIEILRRPVALGSARDEHDRKECEIRDLFAALSALESWALHKRLSAASTTDALAHAFTRLVHERRGRLLAFLGDARRRAAISAVGHAV